jgi:hypothetical protein
MANKTSGAAVEEKADAASSTGGSFPLFFQKPVALDLAHHGKAGVVATQDYGFARDTNSIVLNGIEFVEAAKCYPIVFTQTELPLPCAVLGLERENYFVDAKGRWKEDAYIPAYVRKYPFVFMDASEQKQLILCIDEGAPQFKKSGGKNTLPLYNGDQPSTLIKNALEFCTSYHNHYVITRSFCKEIRDAGLLVPSQSNAKLANGRTIDLGNFQMIDEQKLNSLPDETILAFHKKGWLPLIYFSLMSGSHWKKLADIAGKREPK